MRSRPDLTLYLHPPVITPGVELVADLILKSRSKTPVCGIELRLLGEERTEVGVMMVGAMTTPQYKTHRHVALLARLPAQVLMPGEHRVKVAFSMPDAAPPSYASRTTSIVYDLHVWVDIPWWPDRSERYIVPVVSRPVLELHDTYEQTAHGSHLLGARGGALYLEASVETRTVAVGSSLRGAISVANVASQRVRRVELSLVQTERRHHDPGAPHEMRRYTTTLLDGAPAEGESVPFHVKVPDHSPTTFAGALVQVGWAVELRVVVAFGQDVIVLIPIDILRVDGSSRAPDVGATQTRRAPPVGRERRALVWAESARRNGFTNDADEERMTLQMEGASLAITVERRPDEGLGLTASVTWARLGIDLAVTERRWLDAWGHAGVRTDDPRFRERFTVRGREAAQVHAWLDEATCDVLLAFEEAAIGDESATLVSRGTVQSVEELDVFVALATRAARLLGAGRARIPPPQSMRGHVPAWSVYAAACGASLCVGDMSLRDATVAGWTAHIATEWASDGDPLATVVRLPLERPDRADAEAPRVAEDVTTSLIAALTPRVASFAIEEREVVARLPAPLADPASIEPIVADLAEIARRLSGWTARGPYR